MAKSTSKVYTVAFERDESGMWVASVQGIAGCHTQGRTIATAQRRIREALALFVGDDAAKSAALREEFVLPRSLDLALIQLRQARKDSDARLKRMRAKLVVAARKLEDAGISRRDAATLTSLSHQRIQQVVEGARGGRVGRRAEASGKM